MPTLGALRTSDVQNVIEFPYTSALVTQKFFIAPRSCVLIGLRGVPTTAGTDGSAVTLSFYKAASGIAVGSGTLLHLGTYDLKGTVDIPQNLTLVGNALAGALNFVAGDSIGYVLSGTATTAVGNIEAIFEPTT